MPDRRWSFDPGGWALVVAMTAYGVEGSVARTTIDIDVALIAKVMELHGLRTKRAAVDFALRRLVTDPLTKEEALAMEGSGWDGDLE